MPLDPETLRQLREAGVFMPGTLPQTAMGFPDLSVLGGQGAIPGRPLQHESVAQLPPWAEVARSLTPIGGVDVAARNLAEAEQAGDYGRGAAAIGQGVASALPVVGRMGRVAGAGYGALAGALPIFAGAPAEAQQASAPVDNGLTPEQNGRRIQLNKQLQRDGSLSKVLRIELEGLNRITEQFTADKNREAIASGKRREE